MQPNRRWCTGCSRANSVRNWLRDAAVEIKVFRSFRSLNVTFVVFLTIYCYCRYGGRPDTIIAAASAAPLATRRAAKCATDGRHRSSITRWWIACWLPAYWTYQRTKSPLYIHVWGRCQIHSIYLHSTSFFKHKELNGPLYRWHAFILSQFLLFFTLFIGVWFWYCKFYLHTVWVPISFLI